MAATIATPDGVLLVDKPAGLTSHDVVAVARRSLGIRRIGHTGTLDPFATGLLVLLVGQATRLAQYVEDEPKVYDAMIAFGSETDSDDRSGTVVRVADLPTPSDVDAGIQSLTGIVRQVPPAFSAKKIAGRRAYAAARAGSPVALDAVAVHVAEWRILARSAATLDVRITCSGGTYVRALARDLGRVARSAAHLASLRRIRSGIFDVRDAPSVDEVRAGNGRLVAMLAAIPNLPKQRLADSEIAYVRNGRPIDARIDAPLVALVDADGRLVALGKRRGDVVHASVVMRHEL
jgi:tRNA pseudouridine55 synthase